jgi:hypothetical protein
MAAPNSSGPIGEDAVKTLPICAEFLGSRVQASMALLERMNASHLSLESPMRDRRCRYCRQAFQPNCYHPQQQVCNQPPCQNQRRSDYHRQKIASDLIYQQVCLESPRKWREAHPDYWKKYRQAHPEQVERNRRQQRLRDRKRRLANLANNTLAPSQVASVQSVAPITSCKQHPFGIPPAAGL